ncbi:LysR substrate-binding domain-containing protein [Pseudomonas aeruginosa]|uniref:LysR substrate-binding domain-containing protein n=1 Tax=Pseudomonas aeruginosa TaxID=287 RepID=UPI00053E3289|nr:LysR substrate-binding domain-containing protein [Pseudomonas aeruginosa]EKV3034563.1 LysR family transcriptional regulator [Pseudomonas aeruginosa]EKV3077001.1 LysR family transcriptional regulator [Pseudomonas aeruginosa]EKW2598523.1 LysR family transcriptional regulator [Pseudomonas aeruginosa]EME5141371.1 LysR family transcriptional regulator [Pseudomonas aeruginosa]KSM97176.1 LysR family transcriptional regulator [Pseudomonas aeruginosa]
MDAASSATDGPPLDTVLLRTFLEIVDSGSFAAAAERLALTPSAISGHIRRLEQIVGASLLARTTRRLELTQAGDTLYAYSRNILYLEREARAKLRGTPLRGRLRIGASEDFAGAWLPQVLQRFRQWHPDTTIDLKVGITADLLRQQERGRLDLVFGKQCSRVKGGGTLLWEEPLIWVYATGQSLPAGQPLPLAVFPEPCIYRESAVTALGKTEQTWRIVFESSSMAGCLSAARSGFAVTVIADSQRSEGLRVLGSEDGLPELPSARFYAFDREVSAASAALIEAARRAGQQGRFGLRGLRD